MGELLLGEPSARMYAHSCTHWWEYSVLCAISYAGKHPLISVSVMVLWSRQNRHFFHEALACSHARTRARMSAPHSRHWLPRPPRQSSPIHSAPPTTPFYATLSITHPSHTLLFVNQPSHRTHSPTRTVIDSRSLLSPQRHIDLTASLTLGWLAGWPQRGPSAPQSHGRTQDKGDVDLGDAGLGRHGRGLDRHRDRLPGPHAPRSGQARTVQPRTQVQRGQSAYHRRLHLLRPPPLLSASPPPRSGSSS